MEFEQHRATVFEYLTDRISRREPRDIARTQNNRHTSATRPLDGLRLPLLHKRRETTAGIFASHDAMGVAKEHAVVEPSVGQHFDSYMGSRPVVRGSPCLALTVSASRYESQWHRDPRQSLSGNVNERSSSDQQQSQRGQRACRYFFSQHCRVFTGAGPGEFYAVATASRRLKRLLDRQ